MENTNKQPQTATESIGVTEMQTKKQVIEMFKKNIKNYAIPRGLNQRTKKEVVGLYNEAVELGLILQRGGNKW